MTLHSCFCPQDNQLSVYSIKIALVALPNTK